jgi:hypothetical protein
MSAFFLGPAIGLGALTLVLTIVESFVLTVVMTVLAERYFFPMPRDRREE